MSYPLNEGPAQPLDAKGNVPPEQHVERSTLPGSGCERPPPSPRERVRNVLPDLVDLDARIGDAIHDVKGDKSKHGLATTGHDVIPIAVMEHPPSLVGRGGPP